MNSRDFDDSSLPPVERRGLNPVSALILLGAVAFFAAVLVFGVVTVLAPTPTVDQRPESTVLPATPEVAAVNPTEVEAPAPAPAEDVVEEEAVDEAPAQPERRARPRAQRPQSEREASEPAPEAHSNNPVTDQSADPLGGLEFGSGLGV